MIVFKDNVTQYLDDLVFDLFDNEYFGFIVGSDIFVDKLIDFI
jgi:hypothetical protein